MPKTNFFIHFFLDILHFKEPCNLIGEISITILFFQVKLFPEKTNRKIFQKIILDPFFLNLAKNIFFWKKGS